MWYLVTGRVYGDDEDTHMVYQADSRAEAVSRYQEDMWAMEGCGDAERLAAESRGEGVFVNGVFESETEIDESE